MRIHISVLGVLVCILGDLPSVQGHGFLMMPPQRSVAYKYGFGVPPNYNHMGLNCGGAGVS